MGGFNWSRVKRRRLSDESIPFMLVPWNADKRKRVGLRVPYEARSIVKRYSHKWDAIGKVWLVWSDEAEDIAAIVRGAGYRAEIQD